jgi:Zn-finger protein
MDEQPRVKDCKVCLLPHDEELHAAVLRVREWHRREVTKNFEAAQPEEQLVA